MSVAPEAVALTSDWSDVEQLAAAAGGGVGAGAA
jgi:hypothetical protein